jgi:hypothetical protein
LAIVGCGGAGASTNPSAGPPRAARFALPSDEGALVSLPLANGRAAVIDAWSPSCVPCKESVPKLVARTAELEQHGVELVLVAVLSDSESTEDAKKVLSSWGVTRSFLIDRGDALRREVGIESLPGTVLLTSSGEVRWTAPPNAAAADVVAAARDLR